jgi:hypothetical protein
MKRVTVNTRYQDDFRINYKSTNGSMHHNMDRAQNNCIREASHLQ